MANPKAVSSTILKNIAIIVHAFYSNKIIAGDIPLLLQMNTRLVQGLVQVFIYVLGIFKRQDPIGVVEDAYQALHIVLFLIDQLLHGDHLVLQQPALSSSINMNLLDCIHEMIQIYLEQPSPDFMNITEYDWLLALSIARTLYLNMWTEESKRVSEHSRLLLFLHSPICEHSDEVRASVSTTITMFLYFLDMRQRPTLQAP